MLPGRAIPLFIVFLALTAGLPLGVGLFQSGLETVEQAPSFTLHSTGYENGTLGEQVEFRLEDYRGQTLLIDFMAIACTSCRLVEREILEPIWDERRNDTQFALLSIDTWADPESGGAQFGGETVPALVAFQQEHEHDWRHALDDDKVFRKYDAVALPKLAVIGPEGQLVQEWTGQPSRADVEAAIERSIAGEAQAATVFRIDNLVSGPAVFLALALVAGIGSFFAPCSIGLIPAYMGFLLQGTQDADAVTRTRRTLRAGLVTGAGIVSIYFAIALLLWLLGLVGLGDVVAAHIERVRFAMALLLIVFGALMFWKVSWDWLAKRIGMGHVDGRRGFFAFGIGYGLAAFGCTGPIFLPTLVLAFAESTALGFGAFLVYSIAVASFVVLAAGLVASGHQTELRGMLGKTDLISKLSALLLIGAGAWLIWFDWQAGVL